MSESGWLPRLGFPLCLRKHPARRPGVTPLLMAAIFERNTFLREARRVNSPFSMRFAIVGEHFFSIKILCSEILVNYCPICQHETIYIHYEFLYKYCYLLVAHWYKCNVLESSSIDLWTNSKYLYYNTSKYI